MADRKENELLIVDRVDYLRGMSGKDSVLIDPTQLPQSFYLNAVDLNNYINNINASFSLGCVNAPFDYGFLCVSKSILAGEYIILQRAYGRESNYGKVSYRMFRKSSGWGEWKIIV